MKFANASNEVIDVAGSGASNCTSLVGFLDGFWRRDFYKFCKKHGLTYEDHWDMSEDKNYDLFTELAYLDWRTQRFTVLTVYDRGGRFRIGGHDETEARELAVALGLPVRMDRK
tara:strand:+ start:594 stop:935 length:342 start_codon:yes stop_codon:yes gene_type:complete